MTPELALLSVWLPWIVGGAFVIVCAAAFGTARR